MISTEHTGKPRVRIIHETNPRKYFPAIFELARRGEIEISGEHRYSVVKEWLRSWLIDRKPFTSRTRHAFEDLWVRLRIPFIRDEVVVLAFAPWDWRLLIYGPLVLRNRIVYHTSWPYWQLGETPRRYGVFDRPMSWWWRRVLRHPNVHTVVVLEAPRQSLHEFGVSSQVIPHAVEGLFYEAARQIRNDGPLRLVFVGELSTKKGVDVLLRLADELESVSLTLIGNGPLRNECDAAASRGAVRFLGQIDDRRQLAEELASQDVLILLSKRTGKWEELFGIVLTEAMAAGLGVITARHVGPVSILGDRGLGNLFDDGDVEGPTALIERLASDSQFLADFKAAHRHLADEYRVDRVADAWRAPLGLSSTPTASMG